MFHARISDVNSFKVSITRFKVYTVDLVNTYSLDRLYMNTRSKLTIMNDQDADDDNGGSDDDEYNIIMKRMKILMMGTPNKKNPMIFTKGLLSTHHLE